MFYYLHDLYENKTLSFPSQETLAAYWFQKFGTSFHNLNVTGNDTNVAFITTHRVDVDGDVVLRTERAHATRRYLVLDEDGRHVDLKTWPANLFAPPKREPCAWPWWRNGFKPHHPHTRGPTLQLRSMAAYEDASHRDDLDELALTPVRDRAGLRRGAVLKPDDFYDRSGSRAAKSNSWKDQTRSRRQWAKHKRGISNKDWRALAAMREPVNAPEDLDIRFDAVQDEQTAELADELAS